MSSSTEPIDPSSGVDQQLQMTEDQAHLDVDTAALIEELGRQDEQEQDELIEAAERQARLEMDRRLVEELRQQGFMGRLMNRTREEFALYGMAVLEAWIANGAIFEKVKERTGWGVSPTAEELRWLSTDDTARSVLAGLTVAQAWKRFEAGSLRAGDWQPHRGASLKTYFVGSLLYAFSNVLRSELNERRAWRNEEPIKRDVDVHLRFGSTPDAEVMAIVELEGIKSRASDDELRILCLMELGYSQEEIAEVMGLTSARAVEGRLSRLRRRERALQQVQEGR